MVVEMGRFSLSSYAILLSVQFQSLLSSLCTENTANVKHKPNPLQKQIKPTSLQSGGTQPTSEFGGPPGITPAHRWNYFPVETTLSLPNEA
jgi:hypothetical protein